MNQTKQEQAKKSFYEIIPKPVRLKVWSTLADYSNKYGIKLQKMTSENRKVLETALMRGSEEGVKKALFRILEKEDPKRAADIKATSARKEENVQKFFGQLFNNNWKQFFKARNEDYKLFLRKGGVKDSELTRKQWSAAWMTYRMFRYGGTAGINFKYVHERQGVNALKVSSGVRSKSAMEGKEFSVMIRDVLTGSQYIDPKSEKKGVTYTTFGDCDESSLLMAQVLRAMGKDSNLGLEAGVYRMESPHANTSLKIGGKWFLLEPSLGEIDYPKPLIAELKKNIALLIEAKSYGEDMKRARAALAMVQRGMPPTPLYNDKYEKESTPKIAAILRDDKALPKIIASQQVFLENAAKKACGVSAVAGTVERETFRRMWGYKPQKRSSTIKNKFLPIVLKEPGGRKKAVVILTDFIAASADGQFRQNKTEIQHMLQGKTDVEQLKLLSQISINMDNTKIYSMNYVKKLAKA